MPDLTRRHRQPELMDQPGLDEQEHRLALRALERINWLSASAGILWSSLRDLARQTNGPIRVLDIATGGGDVPIRLWRKARRRGLDMHIEGCDQSTSALDHARRLAEARQAPVRFFQLDVLNDPLPAGYDVLTSSLFLHHLDEEPAANLLRDMAGAARRMVLINDLARSRIGWWLAYLGTRILTTSRLAHVDGPLSVEGAFTPEEALALAKRMGLEGATVKRYWPSRFLLTWKRPAGARP